MDLVLALAYLAVYGVVWVFYTIDNYEREEWRLSLELLKRRASEGDEVAKKLLEEYQ